MKFFPESNYLSYRNIAVELFEKFLDKEVLELIVSQTIFYTTTKGEFGFTVAVKEIRVSWSRGFCSQRQVESYAKKNSRKNC